MGLKVTFKFQNICLQTLQSNVRVLVTTKKQAIIGVLDNASILRYLSSQVIDI